MRRWGAGCVWRVPGPRVPGGRGGAWRGRWTGLSSRYGLAGRVLAAAGGDARELPGRLCEVLCEGVPVDGATLSLMTHTPARYLLGASDPVARKLEEVQFLTGEGPCVTAAATGKPVVVPDFRRPLERWPLFEAGLQAPLARMGAVYAFPLAIGDQVLGAADLIRREPMTPDEETVAEMATAVRMTAAVLLPALPALLPGYGLSPEETARADRAGAHWDTTHQAAGKLAGQLGISTQEALARLRGHAFSTGRSLPHVAQDVLGPPRDQPDT
ncbi:GAF and ANTAR domain-containing protein [Streptomyces beigongshangae]|uniref:GAF and ANTAR domain-containing protein n=1 Tax=Streptomyces beigongshangae TaxID=2841597 RepID=UPI0027E216AA|nr:GAF and ANTAR domain-containing protein [Streptomyces sp. REN17]